MSRIRFIRTGVLITLGAAPLCADFTYEQTSQITGGALLGMVRFAGAFSKDGKKLTQPIPSTTSLKGNRLIHKTADEATIIDLDQRTITHIHLMDKTYSVMTFDQMKQQMQEASAKMHQQGEQPNVSFDVNVKDTGQTKNINGHDTHEMVMTLTMSGTDPKTGQQGGMNVVSDAWIAPDVPGYQEVVDFHKRLAEALGWVPGDNPLINRPDLMKGMAELYKQGSKLNGMPLLTTIRMGAAVQGTGDPANENAAAPKQHEQQQNKADTPPTSMSDAVSSALGGRFGFGRRKKKSSDDDAGAQAGAANAQPPSAHAASAGGSLIEMTSQVNRYDSNSVDESIFQVPAGFSKITEDINARHKH